MDTKNLRLFALAARKLNISAAGRELGLAPAVASARLAKLERTVGADLLHRTTRRVSLSTEGLDFLPYAHEIIAQEDAALAAMGLHSSEPSGTLRFAASSTFAQLYLVDLLPEFLATFPAINLDLRLSDTHFDPIEGSFDLALRNDVLNDSSFKARKLADDLRVLCASPGYLARKGTPTSVGQLRNHDLIGFRSQAAKRLVSTGGEAGVFDPSSATCRLVLDDGLSMKLATVGGVGISLNSLWCVREELASGSLVRVLPTYAVDANVALWLVYPKSNVLTAKVRVLIDFLIARIRITLPP